MALDYDVTLRLETGLPLASASIIHQSNTSLMLLCISAVHIQSNRQNMKNMQPIITCCSPLEYKYFQRAFIRPEINPMTLTAGIGSSIWHGLGQMACLFSSYLPEGLTKLKISNPESLKHPPNACFLEHAIEAQWGLRRIRRHWIWKSH